MLIISWLCLIYPGAQPSIGITILVIIFKLRMKMEVNTLLRTLELVDEILRKARFPFFEVHQPSFDSFLNPLLSIAHIELLMFCILIHFLDKILDHAIDVLEFLIQCLWVDFVVYYKLTGNTSLLLKDSGSEDDHILLKIQAK